MTDTHMFAEGIYFNERKEGQPDFVLGGVSILPARFSTWITSVKTNSKGYIQLQIKKSKTGKIYFQLDNWEPKAENVPPAVQKSPTEQAKIDDFYKKATENAPSPDDIPF